jgi:hypothetical protein
MYGNEVRIKAMIYLELFEFQLLKQNCKYGEPKSHSGRPELQLLPFSSLPFLGNFFCLLRALSYGDITGVFYGCSRRSIKA